MKLIIIAIIVVLAMGALCFVATSQETVLAQQSPMTSEKTFTFEGFSEKNVSNPLLGSSNFQQPCVSVTPSWSNQ